MRWIAATALALSVALAHAAEPVESRLLLQATFVSGFRDYQGNKYFSRLQVGDEVSLRRERDNVEDANAIRVEWKGRLLGYIPPPDNETLARQLDFGNRLRARIVRLSRHRDPDRRVELEIYLPL